MMILPPIIISVVVSKFFTESIRFETFELISVVGLGIVVVVVLVVVVVRGTVDTWECCVGCRHLRVLVGKSCHYVFKREG